MSLKAKTEERAEILSQMGEAIEQMKNEQDTNNLRSKQDEFKNLKSIKERLDVEIETLSIVEEFDKAHEEHAEKRDYSRHQRRKNENTFTYEDGDYAMRAVVMNKLGFDVPEAWENCLAKSNMRNRNKLVLNTRAVQDFGVKGSNTALDVFSQKLVDVKKYYGNIWNGSNFFEQYSPDGNTHKIPKTNSTTDDQYVLAHDENDEIDSATKGVDTISSNVKAYATGVYPISYESIRDSSFPIWDYAAKSLGRDLSRKQSALFTTGATTEHTGILPQSTQGWKTTASSTTFTWHDVNKLIQSIDYEYRLSPKFALMMHDAIYWQMLDWEETDSSKPLYTDLVNGGEYKYHGVRIIINNRMPSACVADAKVILAGDFDQFLIRRVGGVEIIPINEMLKKQLSVGMVAWESTGCTMLDNTAIKHMAMKSA